VRKAYDTPHVDGLSYKLEKGWMENHGGFQDLAKIHLRQAATCQKHP
jgi:hypothetical protein